MDGRDPPTSSNATTEYQHDWDVLFTVAVLGSGCGLAILIGSWLRNRLSKGYAALWALAFIVAALLVLFGRSKSRIYLHRDPILREFQRDANITRTVALLSFGFGLDILFGLWARGALHNGSTVFFFALASFAVGALLGFLFGIPRVLQKDSQSDRGQAKPEQGSNPQARFSYKLLVNTNLDDVSDWFTKIVVGVGLVELREIPHLVRRLASFIDPAQEAFILSVLVYFSTAGFLGGYLNTRMFVQRAFRLADLDAQGDLGAGARDSNGREDGARSTFAGEGLP